MGLEITFISTSQQILVGLVYIIHFQTIVIRFQIVFPGKFMLSFFNFLNLTFLIIFNTNIYLMTRIFLSSLLTVSLNWALLCNFCGIFLPTNSQYCLFKLLFFCCFRCSSSFVWSRATVKNPPLLQNKKQNIIILLRFFWF